MHSKTVLLARIELVGLVQGMLDVQETRCVNSGRERMMRGSKKKSN
jgi:hypothetical protein